MAACLYVPVKAFPALGRATLEAFENSWRIDTAGPGRSDPVRGAAELVALWLLAGAHFLPMISFLVLDGYPLYAVLAFFWVGWFALRRADLRVLLEPYDGERSDHLGPHTELRYSYLPLEEPPAFAQRTPRGHRIALNRRLVERLPAEAVLVVQAHEAGHIARGHTDLLFWLGAGRMAVWLAAVAFVAHRWVSPAGLAPDGSGGPLAALVILAFIGILFLPELIRLLRRAAWEKEADQWAASKVGEEDVAWTRARIRRLLSR